MKKFFIAASLLLAGLLPASAQFNRVPTPNDSLQAVRDLGGGNVAFSIYAPTAKSVEVAGDMIPWGAKPVVKRASNGVWTATVAGVKPGIYRYHFVVDGVSVFDPLVNHQLNETQALAQIGSGDEFFAMKNVPHGAISERYYHSSVLGKTRRLHVWTPAGYEKTKEKLPVLYLVHGGGDTDNSWPTVGAAGFILDNLLAEGKISPMVVVMPNGSIPSDNLTDEVPLFEQDLIKSIIPYIESNYNVYMDKDHRAMAGLSMGGMETLETMLNDYDKFGYFWVLSSGWFLTSDKIRSDYQQKLNRIAKGFNDGVKELVFTMGGPEDIAYKNCKAMLPLFDKAGIRYRYSEKPGGHTWSTWRDNLYTLSQSIFKK